MLNKKLGFLFYFCLLLGDINSTRILLGPWHPSQVVKAVCAVCAGVAAAGFLSSIEHPERQRANAQSPQTISECNILVFSIAQATI